MVVIDDPRSFRAREGIAGPGYAARLAYQDDPALGRQVKAIAQDYALTVLTQWPVRNLDVHCFLIKAPKDGVLARLEQDDRVRWVQPFNDFTVQSVARSAAVPDPSASAAAKSLHALGRGMKIAVIDTSVDRNHPDLKFSSIQQKDFVGNRRGAAGEDHGTAVVGLIAAQPASANGLQGLASHTHIDALRGCWQDEDGVGRCNTLTLALALDAAIDIKPDVLNLSLTGSYDRILQTLVERLVAQGTFVVAAYDDQRAPEQRFPAPSDGLVYAYGAPQTGGAAAQDLAERLTENVFVVRGPHEAFTLAPMNGYDLVSGHSIAAPHVAVEAILLKQNQPEITHEQIRDQLVQP